MRISYDELGNMLIEGIAVSVRENSYKVSDAFKSAVENMNLQLKTAACDEATYYKEIERLRDTYLEKGTKEWWSYTNKIISYENKILNDHIKAEEKAIAEQKKLIEDTYDDILRTVLKKQSEILKEQESFKNKLGVFTEASTTVKQVFKGVGENGADLINYDTRLNDLVGTKEKLGGYYDLLSAVKSRGAELMGDDSESFFKMIRGLSVDEGAALSKKLMKKSDEDFTAFIASYKDVCDEADRVTRELFSDDTQKAVDESISYMEASLKEWGLSVPEGFFKSGSLSAERFSEGFKAGLEATVSEISSGFDALLPRGSENAFSEKAKSSIFSPTYNFYGESGTITEKLMAARDFTTADKLRGEW